MIRQFDLPDLLAAARRDDRAVLDDFDDACRDVGTFVLTGLPVTDELLTRVYSETLAFFALPPASKEALRDPGGNPYIGWDGAAGDPGPDSAKRKQMYHIGPRISPSLTTPDADGRFGARSTDPGLGLWPDEVPGFIDSWHAYYRQMQETAVRLGEVMAATLRVPLRRWRELTAGNWADLAANYYPSPRDGDTGARNAVHSDHTLFTVLYQDDGGGGGLRMQRRNGQWVEVPPITGTYLVNIGELLTYLTGGRWWAVPHEVTVPDVSDPATRTPRVSIPFFFRPSDDRTIAPFEGGGGEAHALLMSEWLLSRRAATAS